MENIKQDEHIDEVDAIDNTETPFAQTEVAKVEAQTIVVKEDKLKPIALDEQGLLAPTDSKEEWRVADLMLKSAALPQQFKNVAQVVMAMQFLKGHGLNPIVAIRQTTIINGSLSTWGEIPKGLCERSGQIEFFNEWLFDREYNIICIENKNLHVEVWGAACKVKRKGRTEITRSFTMDEAKIAGVLTKNNSVWKYYPRRMIQMRARSMALKDAFPDTLSGIAINEYDHDVLGPGEDIPVLLEKKAPVNSVAEEINAAS